MPFINFIVHRTICWEEVVARSLTLYVTIITFPTPSRWARNHVHVCGYFIVPGAQLVMHCDRVLSRDHSAKIIKCLLYSLLHMLLGVNLCLGCHFLAFSVRADCKVFNRCCELHICNIQRTCEWEGLSFNIFNSIALWDELFLLSHSFPSHCTR